MSQATVAGVAAVIAQMLLSVTITSGFPGFQRSMTFRNGTWSGHDLTYHFHNYRASIYHSPANGGVHLNRSLQVPVSPPPPPPPPVAVQQFTARAGEPPGSQARQPAPALPDMADRLVAGQALMTALHAVATNPHYADVVRSMQQYWPELRHITLPTITIPNVI